MPKKIKFNYMQNEDASWDRKTFDLQITLGLQSCKTKKDVLELLEDVRAHERILGKKTSAKPKQTKILSVLTGWDTPRKITLLEI